MVDWKLYKEGQGKWARNSVAVAIALFAIFASTGMYETLPDPASEVEIEGSIWDRWFAVRSMWVKYSLDYRFVLGGPALIAMLVFGVWQYNHPRWADFLIDTENEMKNRVAWPSRKEHLNASIVVVVAVFIIGGFVYFLDNALLVVSSLAYFLTFPWGGGGGGS